MLQTCLEGEVCVPGVKCSIDSEFGERYRWDKEGSKLGEVSGR